MDDEERRVESLHQLLGQHSELVDAARKQGIWSKERRSTLRALNAMRPRVNEALRSLGPDVRLIPGQTLDDHIALQTRKPAIYGMLADWDDMLKAREPGSGVALSLDMLDAEILSVARPLWSAGKYRQAVNDAATTLNLIAQQRLGRHDISDKSLMGEAFNDKEPERGKSRLRCPGDHTSETIRSQQEGARAFAVGTFQVIRNPAHHLAGDWNPVTAFHHLTALSLVAHWFRDWDLVEYALSQAEINAMTEAFLNKQFPRPKT